MIVSIDGPAGAGKSSVARALAAELGMGYLDTGAMYRALAALALRRGIAPDDGPALAALAADNPIALTPMADGLQVAMAGQNLTTAIREPSVSATVSKVSAHPEVREVMVAAQREALRSGDWVAEGRDVGSNVAPDADVKVYLTASDEERARRRQVDLQRRGMDFSHGDVLIDIQRRDNADRSRDADPLVVPDDAVVIDSSELGEREVIERIAAVMRGEGDEA